VPLAFASESHGTIAFGFFNIETDMLLLDRLFFFASDFCDAVVDLATDDGPRPCTSISGWRITERSAVGDLHGAIAGLDRSGFIGATYTVWPFPSSPAGFKQNPDGSSTRADVEAMIQRFGHPLELSIRFDKCSAEVSIEAYVFTLPQFAALVSYVVRGGYPRWRGDVRPDYVSTMVERLDEASSSMAAAIRESVLATP
jgi:hypothetical protein